MPSIRKIESVTRPKIQTSGENNFEINNIGPEIAAAIFSGSCNAILLGTSSLNTRDRVVINTTTTPSANESAYGTKAGQLLSSAASGIENAGPPSAPSSTLTSVIPI